MDIVGSERAGSVQARVQGDHFLLSHACRCPAPCDVLAEVLPQTPAGSAALPAWLLWAPPGLLGIVALVSPSTPTCHLLTGSALPVTAYDKNGFRILFHFAKECPPGRPDVLVVVVSMLNTAPLPIKSIVLQAAVPKVLPGASRSSVPFIFNTLC